MHGRFQRLVLAHLLAQLGDLVLPGVAMALVEHMIGDARASGFKIVPICPYALAQFRKHPEWSDVITSAASDQNKET